MTEPSISPDKKSYGYTVVQGKAESDLVIPYKDRRGRNKKPNNTIDLQQNVTANAVGLMFP